MSEIRARHDATTALADILRRAGCAEPAPLALELLAALEARGWRPPAPAEPAADWRHARPADPTTTTAGAAAARAAHRAAIARKDPT